MTLEIPDREIVVECDVGADWDSTADWEVLARTATRAAHNIAPELANPRLSVSIVLPMTPKSAP